VIVLAAVGFPLLLWAIGRAVTAIGTRVAPAPGRPHQYLAAGRHTVQITTVVACHDELLVSLATRAGRPLAGVFRVTASEHFLAEVIRWAAEGTPLRARTGQHGAIMLTDPVLGGSARCEPPITSVSYSCERPAS
jgi:hypothetical protein